MTIKTAAVKNINNNQMMEDTSLEFGSLIPINSTSQFFTINDLDVQMLSSGDKVINQTLDELIAERMDWELNEYFQSNERLYSILTKCYSIFQSLKGTSDEARLAKKSFNRFIKNNGLNIPDTNHLMTQVIIVVFGGKSRRTSKYSSALRVAADTKVATNELKDFFIEFGGLDEVIRSKKDGMPRHEKGRAVLYSNIITTLPGNNISDDININDYSDNDAILLLATYDEDTDDINVLRVIQNNAAIKAAFASLASKVTDTELQALLDAEYE